MSTAGKDWLERIHALRFPARVRVMNVCGGHERSISMAGLRFALPREIELIPGPGCPVCVCPEEDVHTAIRLAHTGHVTLVAFGDMLRVPANVPKRELRTLDEARTSGDDVRPIASPMEAVKIAIANPHREVVFFAAGFETTTAPIAALIAQRCPDNLSILLSARLTWPAVAMLLDSEAPGFDALIAPGHVSAVMGPEQWQFVPEKHGLPAAVAGFELDSLLAALYSVLRQTVEHRAFLDNCYTSVAKRNGNPTARRLIDDTLDVVESNWRGIGLIAKSGYVIKSALERLDARRRFQIDPYQTCNRAGEMPPGCDCARVVLGKVYPDQCKLYGRACMPGNPVGPCMVSDEGACRIWWSSGVRSNSDEQISARY